MSDIVVDYGISDKNTTDLEQLLARVSETNPNANLELVEKAYKFSEKAHEGQVRRQWRALFDPSLFGCRYF